MMSSVRFDFLGCRNDQDIAVLLEPTGSSDGGLESESNRPPQFSRIARRAITTWLARSVIGATAGAGVLLILGILIAPIARAEPAPVAASDTVRLFYNELLGTMRNGAALGGHGRYQKLAPMVLHTFDLPFMTKLSIGLAWDRLTRDQQQRAVSAFGRYVTAMYAARFDCYSGEQFPVLDELSVNQGVLVRTEIIKSDGEAVSINYMTHENGTAWQIRDVYLGGTISELATRRSEFSAILSAAGVDGLIAALNKKADELEG